MNSISLQIAGLYVACLFLTACGILLWSRLRRQSRTTAEMLDELGRTYEGQCLLWERKQRDMEEVTAELTFAREQQETLLLRNISNRSTRKEALQQLRSGMRPDSVSATLELPRSEVRLLAKVRSILTDSIR